MHLLKRKFVQDTLVLQIGKITTAGLSAFSSLIVWRLMQPGAFGIYALAESFLLLWYTLDLTGINAATNTVLGLAIGAGDTDEIVDVMALYVKVGLFVSLSICALITLIGVPLAERLYGADGRIVGVLAAGLSVAWVIDTFYTLIITTLSARRQMRTLAAMQILNQAGLAACVIAAVIVRPQPESLVIARLINSCAMALVALFVYRRTRQQTTPFPPLRAVFARAWGVSPRRYWRFGTAAALDKQLAALYIQLPIQLVANLGGVTAVGYFNVALSGIAQAGLLTSAIFENMQAVIPQAVGRGDFDSLRRNLARVLVLLVAGGGVFYAAAAVAAPILIPPLLGAAWIPVIPVVMALCIYGAITMAGGVFGPLYRALRIMRAALLAKVIPLVVILPIGALLLATSGDETRAALNGAWIINALFAAASVGTAVVTLRELSKRKKAKD